MECLIQSIMFYSLYFFLSILLSNVGSALVSDSNAFFLRCWYLVEKKAYERGKRFHLKKTLWRRHVPVNFAKLLREPFLQNASGRLFLWL